MIQCMVQLLRSERRWEHKNVLVAKGFVLGRSVSYIIDHNGEKDSFLSREVGALGGVVKWGLGVINLWATALNLVKVL